MRFVGNIQGKEGSFVIEGHGIFENGLASSSLQIIAGSDMGEFKGIKVTGRYSANKIGTQIEYDYIL